MSFNNLKLEELRKVAETFAVDHESAKNKADLIALLAEEGVSYEMYNGFINAEKGEAEVEEKKTAGSKPVTGKAGQ